MIGVETSHNLEAIAAQLPAAELHGERVSFACRYLCKVAPSHLLTDAEATALERAGIQIVAVWENGYPTSAEYFTREKGAYDGKEAARLAVALEQPDGSAIYFAVDWDGYLPAHKTAILAYFEGVEAGLQAFADEQTAAGVEPAIYFVGAYGGARVLGWLHDANLVTYAWQACAPGWADNKAVYEGHLHTIGVGSKIAGVEVDTVRCLDEENFGAWSRVLG